MMPEPLFRLIEPDQAAERAHALFARVSIALRAILPAGAEVLHVGATAVPGCLTKGDLDIVVRVPAADFDEADTTLAARFARNGGSMRSECFSAFEDATSDPHLGIQVTTMHGPSDVFHQFAELLRQSPVLMAEYNVLKRAHHNGDMAVYRAAKDAFVARVLAGIGIALGGVSPAMAR